MLLISLELAGASRFGGVEPLAAIAAQLEDLTRWNVLVLDQRAAAGRPLPALYRAGVRYRRERGEVWRDCVRVFELGEGDCEDLAAWRVAELRRAGDARAVCMFRVQPTTARRRLIHIIAAHGDGELEDPSRALGMGRE